MAPKPALLGLLAFALAGCGAAPGTATATAPALAFLGNEPPDPEQAAAAFEEVCLASLPSFAEAPAALAQGGFRQDSATGVWAHPTFAMAFRLGGGCVMDLAPRATSEEIGAYFGLATTGLNGTAAIAFDPATGRTTATGPDGGRMTIDPAGPGRWRATAAP